MSCVVASKMREMNKKMGCNTSGDFADAVSKMVEMECKKACARAKSNGRVTVRAGDL